MFVLVEEGYHLVGHQLVYLLEDHAKVWNSVCAGRETVETWSEAVFFLKFYYFENGDRFRVYEDIFV